jgi:hypothetical protein
MSIFAQALKTKHFIGALTVFGPDSRTREAHGSIRGIVPVAGHMMRFNFAQVYCAHCGKPGGHAAEMTQFIQYFCDRCYHDGKVPADCIQVADAIVRG